DPACVICVPLSLGSRVGDRVATGSTTGRPNQQRGSCGGAGAPDVVYSWRAPSSGRFVIDTVGSSYDTLLYVLGPVCSAPELACNDDTSGIGTQSRVAVAVTAGQELTIVVDGFGSSNGSYALNIRPAPTPEQCGNGADDDGDGLTDCADPDCRGSPFCCRPEICSNGIDDDCDGAPDCMDRDCVSDPACCVPAREICTNNVDDDCDRAVDCADSDCALSPSCCVPRREVCTGGRDEDCDRLIDCADPDCALSPSCCVPRAEVCTGGRDEDCDRLIDCADPDCASAPACCVPRPEVCTNGVDDDCDRLTDCADPSCAASPACCVPSPEVCNNTRDDDCDRQVDCADADCASAPNCCVPVPEVCGDGRDQDCDRLVDCADPDCVNAPECCMPVPEICGDGRDQDCDLQVDCADPDCAAAPECCVPLPEVCDDGADQDCDMQVDCLDSDCAASPACMMSRCPDLDLGSRLGLVATGNTSTSTNDTVPSCSRGSTAPDLAFRWTAPSSGSFVIDTEGSAYDTMLYVLTDCGGPELPGACDDDSGTGTTSRLVVTLTAGQSVVIVVDGWGSSRGFFRLNIGRPPATEVGLCRNFTDDDGDGASDCADPDCATDPGCATPPPPVPVPGP
ncbi:MAG: hypothetical protein K8H88_16240, partial [Sandaracinaceae bacterium]|nr:hypothetical protein [Sandaracinaceae bacterium]